MSRHLGALFLAGMVLSGLIVPPVRGEDTTKKVRVLLIDGQKTTTGDQRRRG